MSTPMHATRRHRRPDGAHLTLVYSADAAPEPTQAQEDVSAPDSQAERNRTPLRHGSATVRALIALGTMAAALFHPDLGKQLVGVQEPAKPSGSKPEAAGDDAPPAEVGTPVARPPRETPALATTKTAERWTPGQRTVRVAYTIAGPAPTGRHRKAAAEQHRPGDIPSIGSGRHRRTSEDHIGQAAVDRTRAVPRRDRIQFAAPGLDRMRPDVPPRRRAAFAMAG
ncbi:hypothetical protein PV569_33880 [Streptomyces scabiei]|uniref:hypothetical protein n=1 Tax=Streptomyces TaxID=1883 RepID=UPI001B3297B9|nr:MULTISPECIES: hypothetical protein [Streptomyces]MBP5926704.1 hypothetical protein [Streptomyces sp. LBUM 1483]MDX3298655.1 hypothetical protein [Streptomyces scabiei]MDX3672727.1 hypothetical protein [Streptomyces europaeiscabiei]